jgi:hypothetical protein
MRLVLCLILACAIGALAALDHLAVRAGIFPDPCFYQLARSVPREVDVFIIGSSRMRRGIDPDQLAGLLGVPITRVINFGHGGSLIDADYLIVDELLRKGNIALVLVEANIEPDLDPKTLVGISSQAYSRYFLHLATFRQILANPLIESDQPVILRLYDSVNLLFKKIESSFRFISTGRLRKLFSRKQNGDLADRPNICWHTRFDDGGPNPQLNKAAKSRAKMRRQFYAEHANWFEEGYFEPTLFVDKSRRVQIAYMRRIVQLADEHGSRIAFLNLRHYFIWPPGPEFAKEFERKIGAQILIPDKVWLQSIQEAGYRDRAHLTATGRAAFTTWLAQQLTSQGLWRAQ